MNEEDEIYDDMGLPELVTPKEEFPEKDESTEAT